MAKVTDSTLTVKGKSGNKYSFIIYTLTTTFNKVGGVYIFTRRYQGSDTKYYHDYVYCGKTDDLSTRFDNHHKADCIEENNANCICVLSISSEKKRTTIEEDILLGNNFTCNEVNN